MRTKPHLTWREYQRCLGYDWYDQFMFLHYKRVKQLQPPKRSLFRRTMNLWNEIIKNKRRAENEAWDARREAMFRMPKD